MPVLRDIVDQNVCQELADVLEYRSPLLNGVDDEIGRASCRERV